MVTHYQSSYSTKRAKSFILKNEKSKLAVKQTDTIARCGIAVAFLSHTNIDVIYMRLHSEPALKNHLFLCRVDRCMYALNKACLPVVRFVDKTTLKQGNLT